MLTSRWQICARLFLVLTLPLTGAFSSYANVVTNANQKAALIASDQTLTPFAVRMMAAVQVSVFEAVNAITGHYAPFSGQIRAEPGAAVDAAVASAVRTVLITLKPSHQAAIETDYDAALAQISSGPARDNGVRVGQQAAEAVLAWRGDDRAEAPNDYRPRAAAGTYVPTTLPAVPHWGKRRPWIMTSGAQFRPGPPPSLTSDIWARDLNEIKMMGCKISDRRTPEQTKAAQFWEVTAPTVYWSFARSAIPPEHDITETARLFAMAAVAMDDAIIAVFDAKYAYNFWRPITAIRNADLDSNEATTPDPGWVPLIETPMHPEYPCAHCIVSGALGAVLEAGIGTGSVPNLCCTSPSDVGTQRTYHTISDFVKEVAEARICDGVHFRNSAEVGTAMGKEIGRLVVKRFPGTAR